VLLYVASEHPSVSQTFVVTEAKAVSALGLPVVGYALRRGTAPEAAADLDIVCPPPSLGRLIFTGILNWRRVARAVWSARRFHISGREAARLIFAEVHATYASKYARRAGVTHVHAHFLGRTSDVAYGIADRLGCAWTATAHAGDAYAPLEPRLLSRRLQAVAGISCANRAVRAALDPLMTERRVPTEVVHCGVDTSALPFSPANPAHDKHILTTGRLVATKGHWTVLQAAAQLLADDEAVDWSILGGGPLHEELEADPRYRKLYPRLSLAGPVSHQTALRELRRASVFVLPCEADPRGNSDGIPVAIMEAMALGVPVITTRVGGITDLVDDGHTGFLIPPHDPDALVAALNSIFSDLGQSSLQRLLVAARQKVEQEFSASSEAEKLADFLRQVSGVGSGVISNRGASTDRSNVAGT
jgi:colanic acid/amylovoran biosynthesis glycosyltransferase